MIEIKSGLPDYKINLAETITKTGHAQQLSFKYQIHVNNTESDL